MTTHLVKHQKLTKRQIKEDPLVTAAFRGAALWEEHGSRILIAVGGIVLVALLAFGVGDGLLGGTLTLTFGAGLLGLFTTTLPPVIVQNLVGDTPSHA